MADNPASVDDLAFEFRLNPNVIFTILVWVTALLFVVSLIFTTIVYVFEPARMPPWHFWPFLVNLEETHNVPGWYDASLLLIAGLLLLGIGSGYLRMGRRWFGIGWCWLACGFFYLSLDVTAARMDLQHSLTSQSGMDVVLAWVLPVAFAIGGVLFLWSLPPETRRDFVFAAIVLGFGAVVLDSVANSLQTGEIRPMSSRVASNIEEAMEMLGAALFIRAALVYIAVYCRDIEVRHRASSESGLDRGDSRA